MQNRNKQVPLTIEELGKFQSIFGHRWRMKLKSNVNCDGVNLFNLAKTNYYRSRLNYWEVVAFIRKVIILGGVHIDCEDGD